MDEADLLGLAEELDAPVAVISQEEEDLLLYEPDEVPTTSTASPVEKIANDAAAAAAGAPVADEDEMMDDVNGPSLSLMDEYNEKNCESHEENEVHDEMEEQELPHSSTNSSESPSSHSFTSFGPEISNNTYFRSFVRAQNNRSVKTANRKCAKIDNRMNQLIRLAETHRKCLANLNQAQSQMKQTVQRLQEGINQAGQNHGLAIQANASRAAVAGRGFGGARISPPGRNLQQPQQQLGNKRKSEMLPPLSHKRSSNGGQQVAHTLMNRRSGGGVSSTNGHPTTSQPQHSTPNHRSQLQMQRTSIQSVQRDARALHLNATRTPQHTQLVPMKVTPPDLLPTAHPESLPRMPLAAPKPITSVTKNGPIPYDSRMLLTPGSSLQQLQRQQRLQQQQTPVAASAQQHQLQLSNRKLANGQATPGTPQQQQQLSLQQLQQMGATVPPYNVRIAWLKEMQESCATQEQPQIKALLNQCICTEKFENELKQRMTRARNPVNEAAKKPDEEFLALPPSDVKKIVVAHPSFIKTEQHMRPNRAIPIKGSYLKRDRHAPQVELFTKADDFVVAGKVSGNIRFTPDPDWPEATARVCIFYYFGSENTGAWSRSEFATMQVVKNAEGTFQEAKLKFTISLDKSYIETDYTNKRPHALIMKEVIGVVAFACAGDATKRSDICVRGDEAVLDVDQQDIIVKTQKIAHYNKQFHIFYQQRGGNV